VQAGRENRQRGRVVRSCSATWVAGVWPALGRWCSGPHGKRRWAGVDGCRKISQHGWLSGLAGSWGGFVVVDCHAIILPCGEVGGGKECGDPFPGVSLSSCCWASKGLRGDVGALDPMGEYPATVRGLRFLGAPPTRPRLGVADTELSIRPGSLAPARPPGY